MDVLLVVCLFLIILRMFGCSARCIWLNCYSWWHWFGDGWIVSLPIRFPTSALAQTRWGIVDRYGFCQKFGCEFVKLIDWGIRDFRNWEVKLCVRKGRTICRIPVLFIRLVTRLRCYVFRLVGAVFGLKFHDGNRFRVHMKYCRTLENVSLVIDEFVCASFGKKASFK